MVGINKVNFIKNNLNIYDFQYLAIVPKTYQYGNFVKKFYILMPTKDFKKLFSHQI